MFGILVKKQMAEIFRGYFYDAKKNKKRSKISTILFMLMYVILSCLVCSSTPKISAIKFKNLIPVINSYKSGLSGI